MDSGQHRSVALRLVVISVGVVITLLASFLLLVVLNAVVEALFYSAADDGGPAYADPDAPGVPARRRTYA